MSRAFGPAHGYNFWDIRIMKGEELPFDGVPDGSSIVLKDDQTAGAMFYDEGTDAWYDMYGKKWTREDKVWIP